MNESQRKLYKRFASAVCKRSRLPEAEATASALLSISPPPVREGWGEWTPGVSRESAVATAIDEADAVNGLAGLALDRADLDALVAEVASDPEWYGSLATIARGGEPLSEAGCQTEHAIAWLQRRFRARGELPAAAQNTSIRRAVQSALRSAEISALPEHGGTGWVAD